MPDLPQLSETKRALLERYLRGDIPRAARAAGGLTQHTETEVTDSCCRATVIQAGESKRAFFFLHGYWKGDAFYCYPLAHGLGSDQPFYALEPYTFDNMQVPPVLETIAAAHMKVLRTIQPEGPYLLGGFCNGALVAYEIARQLHAEGQAVGLLVLMDPMAFSYAYPLSYRLLYGVIRRFGSLMRLGPDKQLDWFVRLRHLLREIYTYLRGIYSGRLKDPKRLGPGEQIELGQRSKKVGFALPHFASLLLTHEALHQDYEGIFDWVSLGYKPSSVYPGKITFLWPSEELWHSRWWRKVAEVTETEVHVIPGTQATWKIEHLHDLSACLRTCLTKVQAALKA